MLSLNLDLHLLNYGQMLSNRYDIIPERYCKELSNLRANVKPMSFIEVKEILELQYGNLTDVFATINKVPIGSASIAQVHKAKLLTGEEVVIKVQRKNIYDTMFLDVKLMKKAINILHLNSIIKIINLTEILDEMFETAKEELNFEIEAKHLEEFRENNKEINYISAPKVYKNLICKNILVMEYIEGISLDNKEELIKNGYELKEIGEKLAENYITQAIDDGFFHADPHPDNILVKDGKIVYIDLGMMGRLSSKNKELLKKCMKAIIREDSYEIERILLEMCDYNNTQINNTKLIKGIERILSKYLTENIKDINTLSFLNDVFSMLKDNKLKLNKGITMLIRGIVIIEGTLETLTPDLNLFIVLYGRVKNDTIKEMLSKESMLKNAGNIINAATVLPKIPNEMYNLLATVNRGESKIGIEMTNSDKQIDKLENMLHQVIIGILDAAVILGATMVNNTVLRNIYIVLAIFLTIWLIIKMFIDYVHKGM